jgi:iron complex outermembrane receptor protein
MLRLKNGASGLAVAVGLLAAGVTLPSASQAQEATSADTTKSGEVVVVTGTRTRGRTVADSAVPVDVLTSEAITAVAFTDTQDVLKTLVPSFNTFRQPISDGATFIRPATLRGLTSDKTLVLVNSKRRHRAALVTIGGSGTQGPDVATIPASALKTVEVLRDGAAAQYGSDAIAGVLNFILKDNDSGGELSASMGQYTEGDGDDITVSGNLGLPLGESGFVSISVEANSAKAPIVGINGRVRKVHNLIPQPASAQALMSPSIAPPIRNSLACLVRAPATIRAMCKSGGSPRMLHSVLL